MMNISYKRNSNSNFMIIQCEHIERYELKMICENKTGYSIRMVGWMTD